MSGPEPDVRGPMHARQHTPLGELPSGIHPTFFSDAALREKGALRTYSHWVRPGDLVFDVGANLGVYTHYFELLSCRVVAVEPQADVAAEISERATVLLTALGAQEGQMRFLRCDNNHMMSTARSLYRDEALAWNNSFSYSEATVPVTTLDRLIERYGVPAFTKIDVEGFEVEILRGLTTALPALSLEIQPWDQAKTGAMIAELARLGDYDLLYSEGETFELEEWTGYQRMYGDLYATLRPVKIVGLVSSFREGPMLATAIRSLAALDHVVVFEGPVEQNPAVGPRSERPRGKEWTQAMTWVEGSWASDAAKRTAMVEWVQARRWLDGETWGLWLDGDEILAWGEYLHDWVWRVSQQGDEGNEVAGWPIPIVELDGSVTICMGKLVRVDLIRRYLRSSSHIELVNGSERTVGNVLYWTVRDGPLHDNWRARPPLACEPHLIHRSILRSRLRDVERQHVAEERAFRDFEGVRP